MKTRENHRIDIGAWYETYLPMVMRRCRRLLKNEEDAFDAAQDVFLSAMKRPLARKTAQGQTDVFPSSFLYTIATRVCLNRLHRKTIARRRLGVESVSGADADASAGTDEDCGAIGSARMPGTGDTASDAAKTEAKMIIDAILKTESAESRAICFMYHADGMTLAEIAGLYGISISGVRKRLLALAKRARINAAHIGYEGKQ
jgi:RNA polymerase sigma-70 factor (ECF subfamily)